MIPELGVEESEGLHLNVQCAVISPYVQSNMALKIDGIKTTDKTLM